MAYPSDPWQPEVYFKDRLPRKVKPLRANARRRLFHEQTSPSASRVTGMAHVSRLSNGPSQAGEGFANSIQASIVGGFCCWLCVVVLMCLFVTCVVRVVSVLLQVIGNDCECLCRIACVCTYLGVHTLVCVGLCLLVRVQRKSVRRVDVGVCSVCHLLCWVCSAGLGVCLW